MAINVCTFSGNIGKDAEQRFTPNGKCVASFSLPVKQGYGEHEKTSWVTCKMFGPKAEKLPEYLTKGTKVTVVGEFVLEEWESNGEKKSMPVLIVSSLDFGGSQQKKQAAPQQQMRNASAPQQVQYNDVPDDFDTDTIPF